MPLDAQLRTILEKSEELFLRYGIRSVTMDDLARHVGMSKKTIYQHVDNKDDLVMRMGMKLTLEEVQQIEPIIAESEHAIDEMWRIAKVHVRNIRRVRPTVLFDLQKYHPKVWAAFHEHTRTTVVTWLRNNLERGIREGLYRNDLDVTIIAKMHVAMSWAVVDETTFPLQEFAREQLFLQFICYHMNGVMSGRGREIFNNYLKEGL